MFSVGKFLPSEQQNSMPMVGQRDKLFEFSFQQQLGYISPTVSLFMIRNIPWFLCTPFFPHKLVGFNFWFFLCFKSITSLSSFFPFLGFIF